ncbi:MAG TPA: tripartite tricarboxylate transporter substrate-binding protein [Burkholderiales bacterium]|nr:tripartite tricarboxylate transporter substrate-binding protein [Burkholderiales bacterium]
MEHSPRALTAQASVRVLHAKMSVVIAMNDFKERMAVQGFETTGSTPEQFRDYIAKETAKWGPLVIAAGMKPE